MGGSPNWTWKQVPTPAQWNAAWTSKQDDLGLSLQTVEALQDGYFGPFIGATSIANGAQGFVPYPAAGQQNYVLTGSGLWASPSSVLYRGTVTLAANATSTTVTLAGCLSTSDVFLRPTTQDAALENPAVVCGVGSFVIGPHASNALTDRTYRFLFLP